MAIPPPNAILHLSGLNGIRAIAVIIVVIAHTTASLGEFNLDSSILPTTPAGFGVSVFFSLSGFLITYLLLLEKEKQEISIKSFYIRRILRIHPLYFLYLAVCIVVIYLGKMEFSSISLFCYIFFAANIPFIIGTELPFLGHYWSLGVEEQFYIFYPWIVKKVKELPKVLILLTLSIIFLKLVFRLIDIEYGISLPYLFLHTTRFQCMLIGGIGAIYYYKKSELLINFSTNFLVQLISWCCFGLITLNYFHVISVLDQEITALITVIIILGQITKRNRIINLNLNFFDFTGKISYGIYVIHPLIILLFSKILPKHIDIPIGLKYVLIYFLIFTTTTLIASLSYEFFEKFFLLKKYKYSVIKSSSTKQDKLV